MHRRFAGKRLPWQEDVAAKHNAVLADMERIKGDKLELEKELRKVSIAS